MPIFRKPFLKNIVSKTREMPEGLWTKCPSCSEVIHNLALEENLRICPKCEHHFTMGSKERIASLIDEGTFEETDANMTSVDTLEFKGVATYTNRLKSYQDKTGLTDAVITGTGKIDGKPVGIAVMDFSFLAATMGSVVGEKITRIIELSTKKKMGVVIVCASGGARMYEGMLSLMQMAKTSGALARHAEARLPYLTVLTNPTTAGVMASYASLGDVLIAEPKSMIGFAGPRVIKETTHQDLPPGFQTAEFLEKHGLIDIVASRTKLRGVISQLLDYLAPASK
ncbi:acetyl-CoA carboxylase carboxyl transferase subunit beta [Terrimicrobium sacchariphilum]|jgi:acetyl-CoA carboxylase carboxyl transferase subunit beta|uniref:Acetyl-coenzyme A carboxylase carboxyl transferase subunit beta n=1 Tax=Terrimicrobium sacchariphilum TaxID=690879 RepID=A0A146G947_TERSA|nr:acetyl-CoA carboxylase, carboxyltransferase subunit beta [Terrimicrobium sacchariphilum]GAT34209.1 acetyl-CoA carboxylase carboxyl transferase subunit beta [Terrimicrobium sacchariphilum]